jgi:hypothetical protein
MGGGFPLLGIEMCQPRAHWIFLRKITILAKGEGVIQGFRSKNGGFEQYMGNIPKKNQWTKGLRAFLCQVEATGGGIVQEL